MRLSTISHLLLSVLVLFSLLYACASTTDKNTQTPPSEGQDTLTATLYFAGDIMMHLPQVKSATIVPEKYDIHENYKHIAPYIKEADLAIANLETTFGGKPYRGYPQFSSPDTLAYALRDVGFDLLTTANNHCVDRGKSGLIRTLDILDKVGLKYTGTYRDSLERAEKHPLQVTVKGLKLSVLSYTYGTNGIPVSSPTVVNLIDTTMIQEVRHIKETGTQDFIIICIHWGNEYQRKEQAPQKALAKQLFEAGADLIIGSHPHVVQSAYHYTDTMTQREALVVYSLGNYISNQTKDPATRGGLSVTCTLQKAPNGDKAIRSIKYLHSWVSKTNNEGKRTYRIIPITYTEDDLKLIHPTEHNVFRQYVEYSKKITLSDSVHPF